MTLHLPVNHHSDVIMSAMASQITGISIVCSTVCSGVDQWKLQCSASLAFVRGIHRWLLNSPHKGPVTQKMFPFNLGDSCVTYSNFWDSCTLLYASNNVQVFVVENLLTLFPNWSTRALSSTTRVKLSTRSPMNGTLGNPLVSNIPLSHLPVVPRSSVLFGVLLVIFVFIFFSCDQAA